MPTFKMGLPDTSKLSIEKKVEVLENTLTELINRLMWQQAKLDSKNVKRINTNETVVKSANGETVINGPTIEMYDAQETPVLRLELGYDPDTGDFVFNMNNKEGALRIGLDADTGDYIFTGGTIRTAIAGDRLEIKNNTLLTYRDYSGTDYLNGVAWGGEVGSGGTYGDTFWHDQGTIVLQFYNNLLGEGYTIKPVGSARLGLGATGKGTDAYGEWSFTGTVDFSEAGVAGLSAEEVEGFATVATSGSYTDLIDKPTIPDELKDLIADATHRTVTDTEKSTWNSKVDPGDLATVATSGAYSDLTGKPTIPSHLGDLGVPICRARHSGAQSINTGTETVLAFNAEDFDTDTMHDNSTNNSRITFNTAGKYLIIARVPWDSSATGRRKTIFRKNGTTQIEDFSYAPVASAGDTTKSVVSGIYEFAANDYLEVQVEQTSGGALNVLSGASFQAALLG